MEEKRTTIEKLREAIRTAPEFKPFRDNLAEMMSRAAKRKLTTAKTENKSDDIIEP